MRGGNPPACTPISQVYVIGTTGGLGACGELEGLASVAVVLPPGSSDLLGAVVGVGVGSFPGMGGGGPPCMLYLEMRSPSTLYLDCQIPLNSLSSSAWL